MLLDREDHLRTAEIDSFKGLWQGGYFEGDPFDPMAPSGYGSLGYMSVIHATYLACIKPYVKPQSKVLEIGCGRGAWTKTLLPAGEVWCLDALPPEHNRFWEYIGDYSHVRYIQVSDFRCSMLPDDHFDFLFSFGCFCHISWNGTSEYFKNLLPKLKAGAEGFVLISDYEKFNRAIRNQERLSVGRALHGKRLALARLGWLLAGGRSSLRPKEQDEDQLPSPGRWYDLGTERFCRLLQTLGYEVIDPDVGFNHRDPIVHLRKPKVRAVAQRA